MPTQTSDLTVFIVGAGAVENAWEPVLRSLRKYFRSELTADGANCFLARVIYLMRWYAATDKELLKKHRAFFDELRRDMCNEIASAERSGELKVRKEFLSVVDKLLVGHAANFMLVTTNWDTVVPKSLEWHLNKTGTTDLKPLHIHGSTHDPNTLYLPTEVTKEPYRSDKEERAIGELHGTIWKGLKAASRIVLYGISLSPLDAELSQILWSGILENEDLREVCVVVPDHEFVAHRVSQLLNPYHPARLHGYAPDRLETAVDYTIAPLTRS